MFGGQRFTSLSVRSVHFYTDSLAQASVPYRTKATIYKVTPNRSDAEQSCE